MCKGRHVDFGGGQSVEQCIEGVLAPRREKGFPVPRRATKTKFRKHARNNLEGFRSVPTFVSTKICLSSKIKNNSVTIIFIDWATLTFPVNFVTFKNRKETSDGFDLGACSICCRFRFDRVRLGRDYLQVLC